jgi:hypothetical protein
LLRTHRTVVRRAALLAAVSIAVALAGLFIVLLRGESSLDAATALLDRLSRTGVPFAGEGAATIRLGPGRFAIVHSPNATRDGAAFPALRPEAKVTFEVVMEGGGPVTLRPGAATVRSVIPIRACAYFDLPQGGSVSITPRVVDQPGTPLFTVVEADETLEDEIAAVADDLFLVGAGALAIVLGATATVLVVVGCAVVIGVAAARTPHESDALE